MIEFQQDDGGRAAAGYRGETGDCCARAFAIASGRPYQEVYDLINELAVAERPGNRRKRSNARTGVHTATAHRLAERLGMTWTPLMQVGSGCTTHLTTEELPAGGRYVLRLSKHFCALIDGVVHDIYLDDRDGTRCVYGYWEMPCPE